MTLTIQSKTTSKSLALNSETIHIYLWLSQLNKNIYTLTDGYFGLSSETRSFLSFNKVLKEYKHPDFISNRDSYIYVNFIVDDEIELYERSVYSIWDLFGQIGGLYEIFGTTCIIFVNYFNEKFLILSLVNDMNQSRALNINQLDQSDQSVN